MLVKQFSLKTNNFIPPCPCVSLAITENGYVSFRMWKLFLVLDYEMDKRAM